MLAFMYFHPPTDIPSSMKKSNYIKMFGIKCTYLNRRDHKISLRFDKPDIHYHNCIIRKAREYFQVAK